MAQFMGIVNGGRGQVSRLGHKSTGLRVRANGWDMGVEVNVRVNDQGEDEFTVELTGGSHGSAPRVTIGTFTRADLDKLARKAG